MKTIFQRKVLPLDRSNGSMRVALSDPLDLEVLDDLRLLLKAKIMPVIGRPSEIDRLIKKHFGVAADEVNRMVNAAKEDIQVIKETAQQADEKALAEDADLIKFVNQILTEAIETRATRRPRRAVRGPAPHALPHRRRAARGRRSRRRSAVPRGDRLAPEDPRHLDIAEKRLPAGRPHQAEESPAARSTSASRSSR